MRKFTEPKLLIATHNKGKLEEFRKLFSELPFEIVSAGDLGLAEPDETETTFVGNARIKALAAMSASGLPTLSDDSGICVDALDGAPGVYTADWADGPDGRNFTRAMTRVHEELVETASDQPWTAHFNSTMILVWPDGHEEVFVGKCEGSLVWPPRGAEGHGYDPMFVPAGHDRTFAEMTLDEKNRLSHRAKAVEQLKTCFT